LTQISRAILSDQQKFKIPAWLQDDKPPVTKAELEEKIDQLHSAINEVAISINGDDTTANAVTGGRGTNNIEILDTVAK
jgi:hypothetical protein